MPLSGQEIRVTEAKDVVTVHLVEDGRLLREMENLGLIGIHHGNGDKRGRHRRKVLQTSVETPEG